MTRSASERGFTLIEVLVALIIVALGMLAAIDAVNGSVRIANYLRDKTLAHWVAMNQLAEVRLGVQPPNIDKSDGTVEFAGERWRWTMNVTKTPVKTMRRIDIQVRKDGMPENSSLATITGFYGTALQKPGAMMQLMGPYGLKPGANPLDPNNPSNPNNPNNPNNRARNPGFGGDAPTGPVPEPSPIEDM